MKKVTIEFDSYLELSQIQDGLENEIKKLKKLKEMFPDTDAVTNSLNAAEIALDKIKTAIDKLLFE